MSVPGEAIQDTFLHRLPIPLEYDPEALERDREYWESVGFNFKPLPPKGRKSKLKKKKKKNIDQICM